MFVKVIAFIDSPFCYRNTEENKNTKYVFK